MTGSFLYVGPAGEKIWAVIAKAFISALEVSKSIGSCLFRRRLFALPFPTLWAFLILLIVHSGNSQQFSTIYNFSPTGFTNSDGVAPFCTLLISGKTIYGTATLGGTSGTGTLFKLNTDGSEFTTLHSFSSLESGVEPFNVDGFRPFAGLALWVDTLYGVAFSGGSGGNGTLFSISTNGDNFRVMHDFSRYNSLPQTNSDGSGPVSELVLSENMLYGSTLNGGPKENGTVFKIETDGSGFLTFDAMTNIAGRGPQGALVVSGDTLYGTTGGGNLKGTVFRVKTDGRDLSILHRFSGGADGAQPKAGLLLSGDVLFGTTSSGGVAGKGTVFVLNTNGTGFVTLHTFTTNEGSPNSGSLVRLGSNLFGISTYDLAGGLIYCLSTNGSGFTVLHTITGGVYGPGPLGGLTVSGNTLFGTTSLAGSGANGSIFSLSLLPQLTIITLGAEAIVSWPTSYGGFDYSGFILHSTTNLSAPVWIPDSSMPTRIDSRYYLTNTVTASKQYFRLIQGMP